MRAVRGVATEPNRPASHAVIRTGESPTLERTIVLRSFSSTDVQSIA
jgi:hypothetical protein